MSIDPKEGRLAELDGRLDGLFAAYREACPDVDPGAEFMPLLWRKIEARQSFTRSFGWWARGFVTAAAALCLLLSVFIYTAPPAPSAFYSNTYLEVLDEAQSAEQMAYADLVPAAAASEAIPR